MTRFKVAERFMTGLAPILQQMPPLVTNQLDLQVGQSQREFRFALFQSFSRLDQQELTVDQVNAAQLAELLALAAAINPPSFQPAKLTPGAMAVQKGNSYFANYLAAQFVNHLAKVGTPPQMIEELTVDGGDFILAQLQRLRFNFNRRFKVADYLADTKARAGMLASITAREATALTKNDGTVIQLSGQLGQNLGTIEAIKDELAQVEKSSNHFTTMVTAGQYPLPLLFAIQDHPTWFNHFFGQAHRPPQEQFNDAYQMTLDHLAAARGIVTDLIGQARLDIKVLPSEFQAPLNQLIKEI